jgi:N-acetylmuramoyl-L-alanine amidase
MRFVRRDLFAIAAAGLGAMPVSAEANHSVRGHSDVSRHPASINKRNTTAPHHATPRAIPRKPPIMLDPGHGGKDPGCIGPRGTREKDIVLEIAFGMRRYLLATGRYSVAMTRSEDSFDHPRHTRPPASCIAIYVAARRCIAKSASAQTFSYRASDVHAAAAAQRENGLDPTRAEAMHGLSPRLRLIPGRAIRRETRGHSVNFQDAIVRNLLTIPLLNLMARHARFAVLRAPDIASVLTEVGFLTNRHEETLLRQANHRSRFARVMARAVGGYFLALHSHTEPP